MTYDCFTFFNELDLLEIRLNVLKDVVDRFVLVEARQTFSGRSKPLWYDENKSRFAAFADRIVHLVVEEFPAESDAWTRESIQRNFIAEGLKDCRADDVILISDLDEIPDPRVFPLVPAAGEICMLEQGMYYYFLNYRDRSDPIWDKGTKVLDYATFCRGLDTVEVAYSTFLPEAVNRGTTATKIRLCRPHRCIRHGGWHFSFLGGVDAIVRKLESFSHQEYNTAACRDRRHILDCLAKGRDLFGRPGKLYVPEPFERGRFPDYVIDARERYADLVFTVAGAQWLSVWLNEVRLACRSIARVASLPLRAVRKVGRLIGEGRRR